MNGDIKPEYIIDEQATIRGADIEKVYDDCISWLKIRRYTSFLETFKPRYIKARTNRYASNYRRDIYRTMIVELYLTQSMKGVEIQLRILPSNKLPKHEIIWLKRIGGKYVVWFWEYLDIEVNEDTLRRLFPYSDLKKELNYYRTGMFFSILLGYVVTVLRYNYSKSNSSSVFFIDFLVTITLFALLSFSIIQITNIEKKIREIYPDR
ncbi:MAG: hypothetical protein ACFFC6_15210 [Promethearchaeota archaeon]